MSGCFILISKKTTPWSFLEKLRLSKEINLYEKKKWLQFLENFDNRKYFNKKIIKKNYFYVIKKYFDSITIEKENLRLFKNI